MFATDATHTPLNSRWIGGGGVRLCTEVDGDCPHAVSKAASTKNDRTRRQDRVFGIGEQCKSDAHKTAAGTLTGFGHGLQTSDTR
jgi:hypothetical protein